MVSLERVKKHPSLFRRLTGISLDAFQELMQVLIKAYPEFERKRLSREDRKRAIGAGRKFKLSLEERVFMTLFFHRHYPTYELLGFLFDLDDSNANRNVRMMKKFLKKHIPLPERVREKKIKSFDELLKEVPEIELIIDVTEQERQKPKDKSERKEYYSGKKKRHTIKSQVAIEKGRGLIIEISSGHSGRVHDLEVFERSGFIERIEGLKVKACVDKGYMGIEDIVKGWEIMRPKKKPKGGELSEGDKDENRKINRERVKVEHRIMEMKRYRVLSGIYRGRVDRYEETVELVAGLVNMELMRGLKMAWQV